MVRVFVAGPNGFEPEAQAEMMAVVRGEVAKQTIASAAQGHAEYLRFELFEDWLEWDALVVTIREMAWLLSGHQVWKLAGAGEHGVPQQRAFGEHTDGYGEVRDLVSALRPWRITQNRMAAPEFLNSEAEARLETIRDAGMAHVVVAVLAGFIYDLSTSPDTDATESFVAPILARARELDAQAAAAGWKAGQ